MTTETTDQNEPSNHLIATLTDRIVGLGIASEVGFVLLDETGALQLAAASHDGASELTRLQMERAEGPSYDCSTTGLSVSVPDLTRTHDRWPTFTPEAIATGFSSVHAIPLRLRGDVLGAICLFLTASGGVSPGGLSVVRAMADIATTGLQQQRELDRVHELESQLQHALRSRISIEQAKGIISEQAGTTTDAAFTLLRGYARDHNLQLSTVAMEVTAHAITSDDLITDDHAPDALRTGPTPDGAAGGAHDEDVDRSPRDRLVGT